MAARIMPDHVAIFTDSENVTNELAAQMNYAGIKTVLSSDEDGSVCVLSVPADEEKQARRFLDDYFNASSDARKDEDLSKFSNTFLRPSPRFMSAEEKLKNKSSSAYFYISAASVLLIISLDKLNRGEAPAVLLLLSFLGCAVFLFFGLHTLKKTRELKKSLKEEKEFTAKVTDWFLDCYTAEGLDHMISAADGEVSPEERDLLRRDMIQDHIMREFRITDEAYCDYLVDGIFNILFAPED